MGTRLPGRGLRTIAAAIALALVAACGDPNQLGAGQPTSTAPAATDAPTTTERISVPPGAATSLGSLPPVALTTPGQRVVATLEDGATWCPPMTPGGPAMTQDDLQHADQLAGRVLGLVNVYTASHVDVAGMPWRDWPASGPRVVVGFTRDVASHAAALHGQLDQPDELLVCQVRHSAAEIASANTEIQSGMGAFDGASSPYISVGQGVDAVQVTLRPDQQALADELLARYGDLLAMTLGLFPYPKGSRAADPVTVRACAQMVATGPTDMNGLHARAVPVPATVASGEEFGGTVVITNEGTASASFTSGEPLVGYLVRPGTDTVVGVSVMGVAGVGAGGTLAVGESHELKLQGGTTSCAPDHYAVEPGTYELVVPVVVGYGDQATAPPTNLLVTERTIVTVTG